MIEHGTNPTVGSSDVDVLDLLLVIAENARLLITGPIVAGLAALGITFVIPPEFTATTRILPPQQQQGAASVLASQLGSLAGIAGIAGLNIKNTTDVYIALAKSRTVADRLIKRFDLVKVYEVDFMEDARRALTSATRVSAGKDGLIVIEVEDRDPKRAAHIANAYVEELHRLTGSLAITEAQQRRVFFENQLKKAEQELKLAEEALGRAGAGENLIKSAPQAVVEAIARLKAQVTAQEIRIATMRGYLAESSPELQLALRELDSMRAQLAQTERNQPTKEGLSSDYLNRFRDFKYQETLFELMAKQYELARLDEAREGAAIQVVDPAVVPERKSKPKRALIIILTTLGAFAVLTVFVCVREALRRAAAHPVTATKLERIRTGLTFLSTRKKP